jgi:serine/threonine protein kinase
MSITYAAICSDVKPDNVLIFHGRDFNANDPLHRARFGVAKLADFGMACYYKDSSEPHQVGATCTQVALGIECRHG